MSPSRLLEALKENRARTDPAHPDPSLRGRTYAIPFARVWEEALALASGGLRGWTLQEADEDLGIMRAEAATLVFRFVDDVMVRISLDADAQTRVDMTSASRVGRGDLGANARRIRRFFRVLDRRLGAGPDKILMAGPGLLAPGLLALLVLLGCEPPPEPPPSSGEEPAAPTRNFQGRSYERHIVFLTARGDSTLLVPWSFSARTKPGGVDRAIRGWLARSDTWDPFLAEVWETPPSRVPWRILPRGPARIIVGPGDALERVYFQEGARRLEVELGNLLVEWTGQRAETFRVHQGSTVLSSGRVQGFVLDMARAWRAEDPTEGDWAFLVSGDSLQVIMEDQGGGGPEGGRFAVWARIRFSDRQWQGVRMTWSETRAFEPARRDVPMAWEVRSADQSISGFLSAVDPLLEVLEGDGPILPLRGLFQVSGTLTLEGGEYPVRGVVRHTQR